MQIGMSNLLDALAAMRRVEDLAIPTDKESAQKWGTATAKLTIARIQLEAVLGVQNVEVIEKESE